MNAATNLRHPVSDIVAALQAQLAAVRLPPPNQTVAAFQRVELFDSESLEEAFQFLLITEQRVCVIVPLDERFEPKADNRKLIVTRSLPVALICSDRVLGKRKLALWGDPAATIPTPGAFGLMELALPAVTGQLLANSTSAGGVVAEPHNASILSVHDKNKKLPGRISVVLEVHCRGGRLEAAFGPGNTF